MKKIYCLLGFIVCAFYACLEDKGNDIYRELNDVTIERMKDTTVDEIGYSLFREGFGCGDYEYTGGIFAYFRDDG